MAASKSQGARVGGRSAKQSAASPSSKATKPSTTKPKAPAAKPKPRLAAHPRGSNGGKPRLADPDDLKYVEINNITKAAFLGALAVTGIVSRVCTNLKISPGMIYAERNTDEDFAKAWDQAIQQSFVVFEDEARRRAFEGTLRPVYQQGMKVGEVREFSDTLAQTFLRAGKPEAYSERTRTQLEHGGGVSVSHVFAQLSAEELDEKLTTTLGFIAATKTKGSLDLGPTVGGTQVDVAEALHPSQDEDGDLDPSEVQKGA